VTRRFLALNSRKAAMVGEPFVFYLNRTATCSPRKTDRRCLGAPDRFPFAAAHRAQEIRPAPAESCRRACRQKLLDSQFKCCRQKAITLFGVNSKKSCEVKPPEYAEYLSENQKNVSDVLKLGHLVNFVPAFVSALKAKP
jgi:hypothetical protein